MNKGPIILLLVQLLALALYSLGIIFAFNHLFNMGWEYSFFSVLSVTVLLSLFFLRLKTTDGLACN
jgi:hypothetical protein